MTETPNHFKEAFDKLTEFVEAKPEDLKAFYAQANKYFMDKAHEAQNASLNGFTYLLRMIRGDHK